MYALWRPDHFDDMGRRALLIVRDLGRNCRDMHRRVSNGEYTAFTSLGSNVGRSPCKLTTTSELISGSTRLTASNTRSEPDAWSSRVITASPPALRTGRGDFLAIGCDDDTPYLRGHGPAPAMHDHRLAMDIRHRLVWQAGLPSYGPESRSETATSCYFSTFEQDWSMLTYPTIGDNRSRH